MIGLELLGLAATTLVALGAWESAAHRRRLARIPVRVHVSGTRGKSSLTRLIAAGLRRHGVTTAAKTTGTLPRMILPDGRELPVFRPAGPNIIEQIRIVSAAHALGAQAMVLECMALQPELHWLAEHKLVRATHGVITNVRADHLDVMGPTVADVGRALAGMIPVGGVLITAEREQLSILREAAADRGTRLVTVEDEDLAAVSAEELARFGHTEHGENVALALKVLAELGVPRATALEGMAAADPDPGALTEAELDFFGRRVVFVNAFAANDPLSTERIWRLVRDRHAGIGRTIALFNLRADRPSRTVQLACDCDFWREADRVVLMGSGAYLFARMAARRGVDADRFVYADHTRVDEIFETLIGLCRETTLIVGMANIGGDGLALVRYFSNRARLRARG
ncbi:MAG: poly-gamma-glutamate synthase PgsB [Proteobacteria bacterium]|nr:poly-gamma-glutamate synthase PgsB [Pseudomonadota bacterium]